MHETPEMPMECCSLVFTLQPEPAEGEPRPLPAWWGPAVQSLVFEVLRAADPDAAAALHDESSGPRPFTASTLMGPRPRDGALLPGAAYSFRLTTLNTSLADCLHHAIQPGQMLSPGSRVELDYLPFTITRVALTPQENEWAGETTYQELAATHILTTEPPPRQISLELASPTAFRSNDRTQPLPLPHLVFHSLAARWNAYATMSFPAELEQYATECLAISRFNLASRPVPIRNGMRIGAVGRVTFTALNYDRYWMGVLHALAAYARYAGIGILTGTGMGQARPAAA